jgi:two-component system, LuxR family, response regulator FixJ
MNVSATHFYIVDDDLSFGKSLKRLLNARGMSADYFGSAQSFLDSIPPDQRGYAIVDIHMPDLDGFTLMNRMREMKYAMRVIIITGQPAADNRNVALEGGALGFLQKPFSEESLLELVRQDMDGSN